jgi:hypothetical protein
MLLILISNERVCTVKDGRIGGYVSNMEKLVPTNYPVLVASIIL